MWESLPLSPGLGEELADDSLAPKERGGGRLPEERERGERRELLEAPSRLWCAYMHASGGAFIVAASRATLA